MQQARSYVGVDVSKHYLDVAFPDAPSMWRTTNDPAGIAALARRMIRLEAPQLVCEVPPSLALDRAHAARTFCFRPKKVAPDQRVPVIARATLLRLPQLRPSQRIT